MFRSLQHLYIYKKTQSPRDTATTVQAAVDKGPAAQETAQESKRKTQRSRSRRFIMFIVIVLRYK